MGVTKYAVRGKSWWRVDEWLSKPDGRMVRYRKKRIPTREQAMALAAKAKAESFEGRFFDRLQSSKLTVADAWKAYEPKGLRDNDAWLTDKGRAAHLLRHLGARRAVGLSLQDVEEYRTLRLAEKTIRKRPPTATSLDNEVELLKRVLNYAVERKQLDVSPIAGVKLLRKPNVRRVVIDEEVFERLFEKCGEALKPIVAMAFDTGMREREILDLTWQQVKLKDGEIHLSPQRPRTHASSCSPTG